MRTFAASRKLWFPRALEEGIAILKSFGDNIVLKSGSVEPMDCLRYSLNPSFGSDPSRKWLIVRNRVDDA
jgi:hypothetical protein